MKNVIRFSAAALALLATLHAYGSTLNITANVQTTGGTIDVTQAMNPAFSPTTLVSSQTVSSTYAAGGYYVRAGFGNLGLSFYTNGICNDYPLCFQVGGGGTVSADSVDGIFVAGATTSDFLKLNLVVDGSVATSGYLQDGGYPTASAFYLLDALGATIYEAPASCGNPLFTCGSATNVNTTLLIPLGYYDGSSVYTVLDQQLFAQFGCTAAPGYPCAVSGDFANTAEIGGATVVDANGDLVTGAVISSGSGYDYTQPLTTSPVPEPASVGLLMSGILLLPQVRRFLSGATPAARESL
jgi:hypothetical protein